MTHFGDIVIVLGLSVLFAMGQTQQAPQRLKLVQKIPLPAVKGRIDHISVDLRGKRLFLAALGNGTMEVIDLAADVQFGAEFFNLFNRANLTFPLQPTTLLSSIRLGVSFPAPG